VKKSDLGRAIIEDLIKRQIKRHTALLCNSTTPAPSDTCAYLGADGSHELLQVVGVSVDGGDGDGLAAWDDHLGA
jgi:hypothetical protein